MPSSSGSPQKAKAKPKKAQSRKVPAWGPEVLAKRLHRCVTMLAIHGFLGDMQSHSIHQRIVKKNPQ